MNHLAKNGAPGSLLVICLALLSFWGCKVDSSNSLASRELGASPSSQARPDADPKSDDDAVPAGSGKPAAPPSTSALHVETYLVEVSDLEDQVLVTGELRANEEVELRAEDSGRIVSLHFVEGQQVEAGELLVKINDADLVAEMRRLQVELKLAQQRERRSQALLEEQTLSQEVYDEARGQLDILQARIAQVEAKIAKTELRAPFRGVIGLREVSEGSYITSSVTIARLQNLDPIKLDFAVPEKYAGQVGRGDSVEFTVAGSDEAFRGRVYAVEPRIDATTRTIQARARAANPRESLFPGAFAKVRLVIGRNDKALMVPAIALIPGAAQTTVYVVEDAIAQPRQVQVGKRTDRQVQVTAGLEAGDRVIVSGIQQVRPGMEVTSP